MKFKLTEQQVDEALALAKKRHEAKHTSFRNKSLYYQKESGNIPKEYLPHFIGLLGEMAWAHATNSTIDYNIYSVRDPGEDFDGIEIKTVTYSGPGEPELKIKVAEFEKKTPHTYVLVKINLDNMEVEILGKISREQFDKIKVKKRYGRHLPENYIVKTSNLEKIS
jgi:hypothetical protein